MLHPDKVSPAYVAVLLITSIMCFVSLLCVGLRFVHRSRHGGEYHWDDWNILASMICGIAFLIGQTLAATMAHGGYHMYEYQIEEIETFLKLFLANALIYCGSTTFAKFSVLHFYGRIFSVDQRLRIVMKVVYGLTLSYLIIAVFGMVFSTNPIEAQWKFWMPKNSSINTFDFYLALAIMNIILDALILAIPQAMVWKLQMSTRRKILVSLVFMLGAFVCVASIARIIYVMTLDVTDLTYTTALPAIWTGVEMYCGIIAACLPIMYSLFKSTWVRFASQKGSNRITDPESYHPRSSMRKLERAKQADETSFEHTDIGYTVRDDDVGYKVRVESNYSGEANSLDKDTVPLRAIQIQRDTLVS